MNLTGEEGRMAIGRTLHGSPRDVLNAQISIEQDDYPVVLLNERGLILECNESCEALFGYQRGGLLWRHISLLFPQLSADDFVQAGEVHPMRDYLIRCGRQYLARNRQGDQFGCNLIFVRILHAGAWCLKMTMIASGEGAS